MKGLTGKTMLLVLCTLVLSIGCTRNENSEESASNGASFLSGFLGSEAHTLPADTPVPVQLLTEVVSNTATVGQPVQGEVTSDVKVGDHVLIPAGSSVTGAVTTVQPARRFGGQAMVAVTFSTVTLPDGDSVPVEGGLAAYASRETAKDTGAIIGGVAGGAILGKAVGKDSGDAVKGAVIGGGIGTAIASRKGDEAHLPTGASTRLHTTRPLELPAA